MKHKFIYIILPILLSCNAEELNCCNQIVKELPKINIQTEDFQDIISKDEYITGTFDFFPKDYEFESFSSPIKIRGRGNSTWNFPKKSYQFKFDEKYSLFDMPEDKKWLMLANYSDKTMIRNAIACELGYMSILDFTTAFHFAEVKINGKDKGLYQFMEKVETGKDNRVKIGDEGFLIEVDQLDRIDSDDIAFWTNKRLLFVVKDPDLAWGSDELKEIESYINKTENILYGDNFKDPILGYSKYLDVDSFVDWYIINEIAKNNDAIFFSSVYMNYVSGEKLKMGPLWDFDIAFGNINYNNNEKIDGFWVKNSLWIERLFEDEKFIDKVKLRYNYFYINKYMLLEKVERYSNLIKQSRINNESVWNLLGKYIWPNYFIGNSFEDEQSYLEDWISNRMDWLFTEINKL